MLYTSTNLIVGGSALLSRISSRIRASLRIRSSLRDLWGAQLRSAGDSSRIEISKRVEVRRITLAEQWGYLSDTIKGAMSRAEEATRCHASAALQLDLAQYALSSLVDELSAVMDVGGRRRQATVHLLDVQPPPSAPRPFGDAIAA